MQPGIQSIFGRLLAHKLLYRLQFAFSTTLESARIVENVTVVVREDQFMTNIMLASL